LHGDSTGKRGKWTKIRRTVKRNITDTVFKE
jgi:hypothetical protein